MTGEHIPTGELEPVKGTPFDFVKARKIGARIAEVLHRLLCAFGRFDWQCVSLCHSLLLLHSEQCLL